MATTDAPTITWTWEAGTTAAELWRILRSRDADVVFVRAGDLGADDAAPLISALDQPLAAAASPLPSDAARPDRVQRVDLDDRLPAAPSLAALNPRCVAFSADVLRTIWRVEPAPSVSWPDEAARLSRRLIDRGWRVVGAPGLLLPNERPGEAASRAGWSSTTVGELEGRANEALTTHLLWSVTRDRVRLVIDGACLTGDQHNGSQALVGSVAAALAQARPSATVRLAVPEASLEAVRRVADVEVVERDDRVDADVVYRPYQLLVPGEVPWLLSSGARLLVGQLDMIGFANPSYHPSSTLFHTVRNLQRSTMRAADGLTFISEFGRRHALAECPDLDESRCFVVSSGASGPPSDLRPVDEHDEFVACLSARFWHKHREHAIRTFAAMVDEHGYEGELRIAGPEPFYGSSHEAELALLESIDPATRRRVRHLGLVDEETRWRLLANARLVLYPSIVEGFGMVPFEAARVGTPSLVADGSALAEVFADTGAVVGSWDEREWAARAVQLIESSARAERLVERIMTRAEETSWSAVAAATWEAIDATIARPRVRLHHEEGGALARVMSGPELGRSTLLSHLAARATAAGRRRLTTLVGRSRS